MNKSLERIYAEWFVKHIGGKECQIRDCEQPDFIIDYQDKKLANKTLQGTIGQIYVTFKESNMNLLAG